MPFRVLFVCTGNICRSPMAQSMLTAALQERLGDEAEEFEVASAGTHAVVGASIESDAARFLDGIAMKAAPDFVARELTEQQVEDADLVLGAERAHRAAAVTQAPRAVQRTFTIREFARLAAALDEDSITTTSNGDTTTAARAREIVAAAGRNRGYVRPDDSRDDDVADPYRMRYAAFEAAGEQIHEAVEVIATRLMWAVRPRR